jgi:hypothetical protein
MATSNMLRAAGRGMYIFGWVNDAGDRGFSAMGEGLSRLAKMSSGDTRRQLKSAAKTLKRSDLSDVPAGIYQTARRHPFGTILATTAAIYLIQRWRRR